MHADCIMIFASLRLPRRQNVLRQTAKFQSLADFIISFFLQRGISESDAALSKNKAELKNVVISLFKLLDLNGEKKTLVVVSPNARMPEYNPRLISLCVHVLRACIIVCSVVYLKRSPAVVSNKPSRNCWRFLYFPSLQNCRNPQSLHRFSWFLIWTDFWGLQPSESWNLKTSPIL